MCVFVSLLTFLVMPKRPKAAATALSSVTKSESNHSDSDSEFSDSESEFEFVASDSDVEEGEAEEEEEEKEEAELDTELMPVLSLRNVGLAHLFENPAEGETRLDCLSLGLIPNRGERGGFGPYRIDPFRGTLEGLELTSRASIDGIFVFDCSSDLVTFLRLPGATFQFRSVPRKVKFKPHVSMKWKAPSRRGDGLVWEDLKRRDTLTLDLGTVSVFNLTFDLSLAFLGVGKRQGTAAVQKYNSLLQDSFLKASTSSFVESRHVLIDPCSSASSDSTQSMSKRVGLSLLREVLAKLREEYSNIMLHAMFVGSKTALSGTLDELEGLLPFLSGPVALRDEWVAVFQDAAPDDLEQRLEEGLILLDPSIEISVSSAGEGDNSTGHSVCALELLEDLTLKRPTSVGRREPVEDINILFNLWLGDDPGRKVATTIRNKLVELQDDEGAWARELGERSKFFPFWNLPRMSRFLAWKVGGHDYDADEEPSRVFRSRGSIHHPFLGISDFGGLSFARPKLCIEQNAFSIENPSATGVFLAPKVYNTGFVRIRGKRGPPFTPNVLLARFLTENSHLPAVEFRKCFTDFVAEYKRVMLELKLLARLGSSVRFEVTVELGNLDRAVRLFRDVLECEEPLVVAHRSADVSHFCQRMVRGTLFNARSLLLEDRVTEKQRIVLLGLHDFFLTSTFFHGMLRMFSPSQQQEWKERNGLFLHSARSNRLLCDGLEPITDRTIKRMLGGRFKGLSVDTLIEVDTFILSKVLPSELPPKLKHTVVALRFLSCLATCIASRLPGDGNYRFYNDDGQEVPCEPRPSFFFDGTFSHLIHSTNRIMGLNRLTIGQRPSEKLLYTLTPGSLSLEDIYGELSHEESQIHRVFLRRAFASGCIEKPGFFNILKKIVKVGKICLPNLGQQQKRVAKNLHTWFYPPVLSNSELPPRTLHLLGLEKWTVDAVCTFIEGEKGQYAVPFETPSPDASRSSSSASHGRTKRANRTKRRKQEEEEEEEEEDEDLRPLHRGLLLRSGYKQPKATRSSSTTSKKKRKEQREQEEKKKEEPHLHRRLPPRSKRVVPAQLEEREEEEEEPFDSPLPDFDGPFDLPVFMDEEEEETKQPASEAEDEKEEEGEVEGSEEAPEMVEEDDEEDEREPFIDPRVLERHAGRMGDAEMRRRTLILRHGNDARTKDPELFKTGGSKYYKGKYYNQVKKVLREYA